MIYTSIHTCFHLLAPAAAVDALMSGEEKKENGGKDSERREGDPKKGRSS